jgi:hypothetical protein
VRIYVGCPQLAPAPRQAHLFVSSASPILLRPPGPDASRCVQRSLVLGQLRQSCRYSLTLLDGLVEDAHLQLHHSRERLALRRRQCLSGCRPDPKRCLGCSEQDASSRYYHYPGLYDHVFRPHDRGHPVQRCYACSNYLLNAAIHSYGAPRSHNRTGHHGSHSLPRTDRLDPRGWR